MFVNWFGDNERFKLPYEMKVDIRSWENEWIITNNWN